MPASYKANPAQYEPLSQMNTTPLIDVLLVLLIMMIICMVCMFYSCMNVTHGIVVVFTC